MLRSLWEQAFKPRSLLVIYIIAAIFVSVQLVSLGVHIYTWPKPGYPSDIMNHDQYYRMFIGKQVTEYNNYIIFKYSFFHLVHGTNLYAVYPTEHWDLFKYSPTFALFMGLLAYLPNVIGLSIWNILNALGLFFAIRMLPFKERTQCIILWFIMNEMFTCLSNTQSNGLMCALIIAAYGCMQRRNVMLATLWLVISVYIKVYGAIGFCLFLFYPDKIKFVLYSILWMVLFAVLPLVVTPWHTLMWQYHNWADLMIADASAALGLSVAGWLYSWFGLADCKLAVTVAGMVLFLIPFARFNMYRNETFRLLTVASMLIWVIIFNHKAESSTFIIAVTGVCIWYFAGPATRWRTTLLWLVFIFTCLSTTDFFPPYVKTHFTYPYKIKVIPCIMVWGMVFWELMKPLTPKGEPGIRLGEATPDHKI